MEALTRQLSERGVLVWCIEEIKDTIIDDMEQGASLKDIVVMLGCD